MKIFLLTDIPFWTRPLEKALLERGVEVAVGLSIPEGFRPDRLVNRVSTAILRRKPDRASELAAILQNAEASGLPVINGSECFEIGLSKLRQYELFLSAGARTPDTAAFEPGRRVFPEQPVLLKPAAGGFGRGIRRLEPRVPSPADLDPSDGWVEQAVVTPSDQRVYRLEFLGSDILYCAASPWKSDAYDYCLANVGDAAELVAGHAVPASIVSIAQAIASRGELRLGALEYFLMADGDPLFIDFNPVSSFHPNASEMLGVDPIEAVAAYISGSIL